MWMPVVVPKFMSRHFKPKFQRHPRDVVIDHSPSTPKVQLPRFGWIECHDETRLCLWIPFIDGVHVRQTIIRHLASGWIIAFRIIHAEIAEEIPSNHVLIPTHSLVVVLIGLHHRVHARHVGRSVGFPGEPNGTNGILHVGQRTTTVLRVVRPDSVIVLVGLKLRENIVKDFPARFDQNRRCRRCGSIDDPREVIHIGFQIDFIVMDNELFRVDKASAQ